MRRREAVSGAIAVAVAIAVAELAAGTLSRVPSPLTAMQQAVVRGVPGGVVRWAIDTFGLSNRAVLGVGAVVVALGIGAGVGMVARRAFGVAVGAFALFGAVAASASLAEPESGLAPVVASLAVSAGAGLAALRWLLRRAGADAADEAAADGDAADDAGDSDARPGLAPGPAGGAVSRRAFLRAAGGMATAAVITAGVGRYLLTPPAESADLAAVTLPRPARALPDPSGDHAVAALEDVTPLHTPNEDFYRIDTSIRAPRVDHETWRLRVHGLVDREVTIDYDELLGMPLEEVDVTLACVSNEVGGGLVGNARWTGVPLADVLDRAGVRDDAEQLVGRAVDGWTAGFPVEAALDGRPALVAVGMNGEPLPTQHGFPARLVVPGLYGYVSATKWLSEIELTTWDFDAYWVPRGWAKEAPIKTASRIDLPRGNIEAGPTVVAGVAWAPRRGIDRVEIQVDDGPWEAAELASPLSVDTWVQWRRPIELEPGEHALRVRAVDGSGQLQPEGPEPPAPDGSEGWHRLVVRAE